MKYNTLLLLLSAVYSLMPTINIYDLHKVNQFKTMNLFISLANNSSKLDACTKTISHILNRFASEPSLSEMISYSGRAINDLGDYNSCKKSEDKYYLLMSMMIQGMTLHVGVCIPKDCSFLYMYSKKDQIMDVLAEIFNVPLTEHTLFFIDSSEVVKELHKVTIGAIFTLILIISLTLLAIICTTIDYKGFLEDSNKKLIKKFLNCFSLKNNIKEILSTATRVDPNLEVLNGIRVLAIGWIIITHCFYMPVIAPYNNFEDAVHDSLTTYFMAMIKCGTIAVDVFFYLSGFLASLSLYRAFKNPKNRNFKALLICYFHRYVRLLPFLALILLYTINLQPIVTSGPLGYLAQVTSQNCYDQWYEILLYYVNFAVPFENICNAWTWYLYVDMQLFLLMPILMLIQSFNKQIFYLSVSILTFASIAIPSILCGYYGFNLSFVRTENNTKYDTSTTVYDKPYCRATAYYLGIILFILYNEGNNDGRGLCVKIKEAVYNRMSVRYLMYSMGVVILFGVYYSFYYLDAYPNDWSNAFGSAQMVISRPLFVIGLGLVIYPVIIGRGKNLLAILGHYIFNPLSKLTYGVYIIHLAICFGIWMDTVQPEVYTVFDRMLDTVMIFTLSYIMSFIATLFFDSPIVQLLKIVMGRDRPQTAKTVKEAS